jgi:hypothetical protein
VVSVPSSCRVVVGAALVLGLSACARKPSPEAAPTQDVNDPTRNGAQQALNSSLVLHQNGQPTSSSTQLSGRTQPTSSSTQLPYSFTQSSHEGRPLPSGSALPAATGSSAASELHSDGDGCAAHAQPLREAPPGASATALPLEEVSKVSRISVSAHQGAVVLRQNNDGTWVSIGKRGCVVSTARVQAALANLTRLRVEKRLTVWPKEAPFELQIDVLDGEEHALHLEIGPRRGELDLAKLLNDDVVELRGIDRKLWSVAPAAWCP